MEEKRQPLYELTQEFYALQASKIGLKGATFKPIEKNRLERQILFFEEQFAAMLYDYIVLACWGEIRHGQAQAGLWIENNNGIGRYEAYGNAIAYDPYQALTEMKEIFLSGEWASGYGGEAWANIAKAGLIYGRVPHSVFIDHVVDLQHNNGTAFSKPIIFDYFYRSCRDSLYADRFKAFLDFKREYDVTRDSFTNAIDWDRGYPYTGYFLTLPTYRLLKRLSIHITDCVIVAENPLYSPIIWGEKDFVTWDYENGEDYDERERREEREHEERLEERERESRK